MIECFFDCSSPWTYLAFHNLQPMAAELQEPVLSRALTRFRYHWKWDGHEATIQSHCTDETGYRQPSREEFLARRGLFSNYHYNPIKSWFVRPDGSVKHV